MEEDYVSPNHWKIKDNKAIIQNAINRARHKVNPYARFIKSQQVDLMVANKKRELNCSELEATEALKAEVKQQLKEELKKYGK